MIWFSHVWMQNAFISYVCLLYKTYFHFTIIIVTAMSLHNCAYQFLHHKRTCGRGALCFSPGSGYHATRWLMEELHLPECTTQTVENASALIEGTLILNIPLVGSNWGATLWSLCFALKWFVSFLKWFFLLVNKPVYLFERTFACSVRLWRTAQHPAKWSQPLKISHSQHTDAHVKLMHLIEFS